MSKKTGETEITLEGLEIFTSYYVKVAAYTKEGNGVKSDKMICTTAQDGKYLYFFIFYIYIKLINYSIFLSIFSKSIALPMNFPLHDGQICF